MSALPRSSHALVTGGGRGIGRAIAAALSQAGATVTVLGRNRAALDEAVAAGSACPYRKSNPNVLMMQAAENWPGFDRADALDSAKRGRILAKRGERKLIFA